MPPTFVASTSTTATAATDITGNAPGGIQSGDLLIGLMAKNTTGSPTLPSGWTGGSVNTNKPQSIATLSAFSGSAPTGGVGIYWKMATNSEPATYTWSGNPAGSNLALTIIAFRGVNVIQMAAGGWNNAHLFDAGNLYIRSGTSLIFSGNTMLEASYTAENHIVIAAMAQMVAATTVTLSSLTGGLTQISNESLSGISMIVGYRIINRYTDGEIGPHQCTTNTGSGNAAGRAFIIPSPDGPTVLDDKRQAPSIARGYPRSRLAA